MDVASYWAFGLVWTGNGHVAVRSYTCGSIHKNDASHFINFCTFRLKGACDIQLLTVLVWEEVPGQTDDFRQAANLRAESETFWGRTYSSSVCR
jgi:hypothetical protein